MASSAGSAWIDVSPAENCCGPRWTPGKRHATPRSEPSNGTSLVKMQIRNLVDIMFRHLRVDVLGWSDDDMFASRFGRHALLHGGHVTLEEVVDEGPDHGNGGEVPDLLPVRREGRRDDVGGALVGGASLKAEDFLGIAAVYR